MMNKCVERYIGTRERHCHLNDVIEVKNAMDYIQISM